jgi:uncharacterized protein involved in exopolysaccharide biosynthesis
MVDHNDSEPSFGDYLSLFRRRAKVLFGIVGAVVLAGVAIAYRVPPQYQSTGVLLAEQPEVPENVVRSTVPDYPEERVRIITQRVLTNPNLERIIEERGLYPALAGSKDAGLREFRTHLSLSAEDPELLENIMGANRAAAAMAFSVSFRDPSPILARDVSRDLVSLYLEENQRARQEQAAEMIRFLTQESSRLEEEIAAGEARLAEFKEQNAGRLPELAGTNLETLDRIERDLEATEQEIRTLREERAMYSSELAQLSPQATIVDDAGAAILGPQDRLKMLQRNYMQLSAVYSQDHPDVLKLRREIEALSAGTGLPAFDGASLQAELVAREDQLAAARNRYSADHPDVRRLEQSVESLREALAEAPRRNAVQRDALEPDNPLYIQRQVQLEGANAELEAATRRRDQLRARIADVEQRLTSTPGVERELSLLTRGREQLLAQYDDVQSKLREAEIGFNLESESKGERFTVLETPGLPSSPSQPNRLAVLLLTLVVAAGLGAGGVAIAERSDTTVRNPRDVARYLEIPPLVAIPNVYNRADLARRAQGRLVAATMVCLWAGSIAFLVLTPAG